MLLNDVNQILGILILLFLRNLIRSNNMLAKDKAHKCTHIICIAIVSTAMEVLTNICNKQSGMFFYSLNIATNIIFFITVPWIPILGAYLFDPSLQKYHSMICVPLFVNAFLTFSSLWNGELFVISEENEYIRGRFFYAFCMLCVLGYLFFLYACYRKSQLYDRAEKVYLIMAGFILLYAFTVQVRYKETHIIWLSVAISFVLYYIFLREVQLNFDDTTLVRSRASYQRDVLDKIQKGSYGIVIMDINDLKEVNDSMGHLEGDGYIRLVANLIRNSFKEIGTIYRIGGDEFCVIVPEEKVGEIEGAIKNLRIKSKTIETAPIIMEYSTAYGYAICNGTETYSQCFQRADKQMYQNKVIMKEKLKVLGAVHE